MTGTLVTLLVLLALGGALGNCEIFRQQADTRLTNLESDSCSLTENQRALEAKMSELENSLATVQALEAKMSELENSLATVQARATKKAAIRATLKAESFNEHEPVPFEDVEQVGGGFDTITSKYTVPYSGWYTLDVQLFPKNKEILLIDLNVGSRAARAKCRNDLDSTCHLGLSMHLEAGEELWINTNIRGPYWAWRTNSFFSAVLVLPDD